MLPISEVPGTVDVVRTRALADALFAQLTPVNLVEPPLEAPAAGGAGAQPVVGHPPLPRAHTPFERLLASAQFQCGHVGFPVGSTPQQRLAWLLEAYPFRRDAVLSAGATDITNAQFGAVIVRLGLPAPPATANKDARVRILLAYIEVGPCARAAALAARFTPGTDALVCAVQTVAPPWQIERAAADRDRLDLERDLTVLIIDRPEQALNLIQAAPDSWEHFRVALVAHNELAGAPMVDADLLTAALDGAGVVAVLRSYLETGNLLPLAAAVDAAPGAGAPPPPGPHPGAPGAGGDALHGLGVGFAGIGHAVGGPARAGLAGMDLAEERPEAGAGAGAGGHPYVPAARDGAEAAEDAAHHQPAALDDAEARIEVLRVIHAAGRVSAAGIVRLSNLPAPQVERLLASLRMGVYVSCQLCAALTASGGRRLIEGAAGTSAGAGPVHQEAKSDDLAPDSEPVVHAVGAKRRRMDVISDADRHAVLEAVEALRGDATDDNIATYLDRSVAFVEAVRNDLSVSHLFQETLFFTTDRGVRELQSARAGGAGAGAAARGIEADARLLPAPDVGGAAGGAGADGGGAGAGNAAVLGELDIAAIAEAPEAAAGAGGLEGAGARGGVVDLEAVAAAEARFADDPAAMALAEPFAVLELQAQQLLQSPPPAEAHGAPLVYLGLVFAADARGDYANLPRIVTRRAMRDIIMNDALTWTRERWEAHRLRYYFLPPADGAARGCVPHPDRPFHVDHILPDSLGGWDHPRNYMIMPPALNRALQDNVPAHLALLTQVERRLVKLFAQFMRAQVKPYVAAAMALLPRRGGGGI